MTENRGNAAERRAMRSLLFDHVDDLLLVANRKGTVLDVNASAGELFGYADSDELLGRQLADLLPESCLAGDDWAAQLAEGVDLAEKVLSEVERDDGSVTILDGKIVWSVSADRIFVLAHDVSEQIREATALSLQVASLTQMAFTDVLTGLPNRLAYEQKLAERLPGEAGGWVVFLDVDDFKGINDRFGHPGGDIFLAEVGRRIGANIGPSEFAARIGGDEFVVMFRGSMNENTLRGRVSFLLGRLRPYYELGQEMYRGRFSAGASFCPDWMDTAEWVNRADQALYLAKAQEGSNCKVAEPIDEPEELDIAV